MSKFRNKAAREEPAIEPTEAADFDAIPGAGNPTGNPAGNPAERESGMPEDELSKVSRERDQMQNQLQRTLADLQNFRKRRMQEMADARRGAVEALVSEMLPVLDNFHLATDYGTSQGESAKGDEAALSMQQGLLMVRTLLESVFERHGVVEIAAEGQVFDPLVHEAVGIDPDPDAERGVVTKVLQRGYTIDGRVLRPSRVMVGGDIEIEAPEA